MLLFFIVIALCIAAIIVHFARKENEKLKPLKATQYYYEGLTLKLQASDNDDEKLYQEAISKLNQAIEFAPDETTYYCALGDTLYKYYSAFNNPDTLQQALDVYDNAIEINPSNSESYEDLAAIWSDLAIESENLEDFEKCSYYYQKASELCGDSLLLFDWVEFIKLQAETFNDDTLYKKIAEIIRIALKVEDEFSEKMREVYAGLLALLLRSHPDNHLLEVYLSIMDKKVEQDPNDPKNYIDLGYALYNYAERTGTTDLFAQSYEKFEEAIRIDESSNRAYAHWAVALLFEAVRNSDKDLLEQSHKKFAEALEVDPDNITTFAIWGNGLDNIAHKYKDISLIKESIVIFDKVISLDPRYLSAYIRKGTSMVELAILEEDKHRSTYEIEKALNKAIELIDEEDTEDEEDEKFTIYFYLLKIYAFVDNRTRFFSCLDQYLEIYSIDDINLENSVFDAVKTDSRYKMLVE